MSSTKRGIPFLRLAWRNTWRHLRRTLLTVSAAAVSVMVTTYGFSHITGILGGMVDTYARTESGHVRIRAEGYSARERFLPVHINIAPLADVLPVIRAHPDVKEAVPRIRTSVLVDMEGANKPGLLIGLDLEREADFLDPAGMVTEGALPRAGEPEMMVGAGLAKKLGVVVGDTLTLLGQTAYRSLGGIRLRVTGIAATGLSYMDNIMLVTPLDQAQFMADLQGGATEILVFANDPEFAERLAGDLNQQLQGSTTDDLEVLSWKDQGPLVGLLDLVKPIFGVILGIIMFMASLIIVNTMMMTVMERTREFGVQAAMGMRPFDITRLIVTEGLIIGLLGAVLGGLLGSGISVWLETVGIDITQAAQGVDFPIEGIIYPDWQPEFVVISALAGLLTAGLATLYPAWLAVRKTPSEALRS